MRNPQRTTSMKTSEIWRAFLWCRGHSFMISQRVHIRGGPCSKKHPPDQRRDSCEDEHRSCAGENRGLLVPEGEAYWDKRYSTSRPDERISPSFGALKRCTTG